MFGVPGEKGDKILRNKLYLLSPNKGIKPRELFLQELKSQLILTVKKKLVNSLIDYRQQTLKNKDCLHIFY
jgi:hypothetical protein